MNNKKHRTECPNSSIEQGNIEDYLADYFTNNLTVSKSLSEWCIRNISEVKDKKINNALAVEESRKKAKENVEKKLNNLLDLRLSRNDLTMEEREMFDSKEKELRNELNSLKAETKKDLSLNQMAKLEKSFDLMTEVVDIIKNGTIEEKKDVLYTFRSNLKFSGKKIDVINEKWLSRFIEALNSAKSKNLAFEPTKTLADKDKTEVFASVCPTLLPG